MLAEDLNAYLELSGGTDASGFLGELSDKLQNMIAKFQTTMDSSILDIMMYTDPDANHLMHPALTDILSAYRSETADGHDDIMRKLRKLNSLEYKQTSGS